MNMFTSKVPYLLFWDINVSISKPSTIHQVHWQIVKQEILCIQPSRKEKFDNCFDANMLMFL